VARHKITFVIHDYHTLLGTVAVLIGVLGYVPYYRDMFRGTTKPHPFTYFVWGLLATITLVAQISAGAGPGAWVSAIPVVTGFSIALFALVWGERKIVLLDWLCLIAALGIVFVWHLTHDALYAVLLVMLINAIAFVPTFRKSYSRPDEETALSYATGALRSLIAIPALLSFNLTTVLPLAYHICANAALTVLLIMRRRALRK
jgi:hypothetical protein